MKSYYLYLLVAMENYILRLATDGDNCSRTIENRKTRTAVITQMFDTVQYVLGVYSGFVKSAGLQGFEGSTQYEQS